MNITQIARNFVRSLTCAHATMALTIEPGDAAPRYEGASFYYTNKSGERIRHPNAYARAWGKPIYVHSTARLTVGEQFLRQAEIAAHQIERVTRELRGAS